jgi:hypothetical protein
VTVYLANATSRRVPVSMNLSLAGLKAGSHTLKVVVTYTERVGKHGHKTRTVTKTIRLSFSVY